jgi:hypothetical protein
MSTLMRRYRSTGETVSAALLEVSAPRHDVHRVGQGGGQLVGRGSARAGLSQLIITRRSEIEWAQSARKRSRRWYPRFRGWTRRTPGKLRQLAGRAVLGTVVETRTSTVGAGSPGRTWPTCTSPNPPGRAVRTFSEGIRQSNRRDATLFFTVFSSVAVGRRGERRPVPGEA